MFNVQNQSLNNKWADMNLDFQKADSLTSLNIVGTLCLENNYYPIVILEKDTLDRQEELKKFTEICRFEVNQKTYIALKNEQTKVEQETDLIKILTERELQIAILIASGRQNKHIAKQLKISEWTVSTHLRRIFTKLGVGSRAAMVYRCSSLIHLYNKTFEEG
ncbi:LuxR C-terminal-related transcriptional regulator [Nostoc sp. CHAB 5844]|nr:LuxR C-terminal-related transcriptional regulator [Nostoc sp. CHAB 5844]